MDPHSSSPNASDIEAIQPEKPDGESIEHTPRQGIPTWKWILTLVGLYLGAMLYGLDTTIAADVQASVYETLGDIENLPWVGLGFPMAGVAVILLLGRLYGLFNVKPLMLTSIVLFEIGSALCGAAPTSEALIVGRVIAGIGGAGMYLGALSYISIFATNKEATLYNALIGLSWGVGAILGPVIGGAFAVSNATWRWAFYINLPLAGLFAPIYIFVFPPYHPVKSQTTVQKLRGLDWIGSILNGAVFVLFMIVVTFGGSTYAWNSAASIALWVVWGVCLIAYIFQQSFALFTTAEHRIFPIHFLRSRSLVMLYIATAAASCANAVTLYYIPLFFQFTRGDSALDAAVRLLPFIVIFIFFVMVAGGSLPMVGRYNVYYIVGGILVTVGGALLFVIDASTSISWLYGAEVAVAAGSGFVFQNAYAVAAAKVPAKDRANAIGFINVAQIGTIAIALAIAGSLFQNLGFSSLKEALSSYTFSDDQIRSALAGGVSPLLSSTDRAVREIVISSVASTIQRAFGTVLASGAVLLVSSFLMSWEKLDLGLVA